jgi:3-oxoacyl-[acyl-carrier protein] reductase
VVTGSVKGIGKSIGLKLLKKGYFVIFNYANDDVAANKLKEELSENKFTDFAIVKCDLSSTDGAKQFLEKCLGFSKSFDYLVLNAGCTDRTRFGEITEDAWDKVMNTNLTVPFFLVQNFSPYINDKVGRIIFIGSKMGVAPHAMSISYGVSKAGVHFLAKSLVKEFAERKITVNAIAPGFIDTPWQKEKPAEQRARIEAKTALNRFGLPEEIADAVDMIIENHYINGTVLEIDGGYDFK